MRCERFVHHKIRRLSIAKNVFESGDDGGDKEWVKFQNGGG
jgi:hypothetical protein